MIGPILFQIGSFKVYTHGFFVTIGVILASFVLYRLALKYHYNLSILFDLIIYTLFFGLLGARLTYFFLYRSQFENTVDILKIWQGGLVSWGGFIFGILAATVILSLAKEKILPWLDLLLVSSLLGLAVGRLGSFLSGELAGLPAKGFLAILGVYPVTLFESIYTFIVFLLLITLVLKFKSILPAGFLSLNVIMLYSLGRFVVDFWRAEPAMAFGLSLGQLFSLSMFTIALIIFIVLILQKRSQKRMTDAIS